MERKMPRPMNAQMRALLARCRRALAQRRDALQLAAMSEHELRDLGIGRSEVPALLRGGSGRGAAG